MINCVRLYNFRNYAGLIQNFEPGLNAVIGSNGRGKTNLLEALFFMLEKRSFRGADAGEIVRKGERQAKVEGTVGERGESQASIIIGVEEGVRAEKTAQDQRAVCFQPDDIWMIKGGPEERRRGLDEVIVGVKRGYRETLREYQRVLKQRNEAVKEIRRGSRGREAMRIWNPLLVDKGMEVVRERRKMLSRMQKEMALLSERWGKGGLEAKYYSSFGEGDEASAREKMKRMEESEIRRGTTLMGPHRDEVLVFLGGRNLRRECSQGEQKLAVIMWKLAQAEIIRNETGREVVLLMDDCLSELDAENRSVLLTELERWPQVILTATDAGEELKRCARIYLDGE